MPTQPTLTLTRLSATSFQATISGADPGSTNTLYYRKTGQTVDTTGPAIVGNGQIIVGSLVANAGYIVYVVSDLAGNKSLPALQVISLGVSDTLSGAIVAAYQGNPALVAVCPNLWDEEVPETDAVGQPINLPFAQLEVPDENPEWTFEAGYYEVCHPRITIYATTAQEADQIVAAFKGAFDWQALPFQTATAIQVMRQNVRRGAEEVVDKDNNRVFHRIMEYQIMVSR